jgi:hypothetical protein
MNKLLIIRINEDGFSIRRVSVALPTRPRLPTRLRNSAKSRTRTAKVAGGTNGMDR